MLRTSASLTYFALSLFAAGAAVAAEQGDSDDPRESDESKSYTWGLGVAAFTQQTAYTDIDAENMAFPLIYFENRWVELLGPWLDLKLPALEWDDDQELTFALRVQLVGFDGYEAKDAPILNGMAERKSGTLVGPSVEWENPFVNVSAEWMFDAANNSKGQQAAITLERSFSIGENVMITPSVTGTWLDRKHVNYYYGVRDTEARLNRPAFTADSTVNAEIALQTDYSIDQHQSVFLSLGYTALGSEIKDSPLTDSSGESMVILGYLYRF